MSFNFSRLVVELAMATVPTTSSRLSLATVVTCRLLRLILTPNLDAKSADPQILVQYSQCPPGRVSLAAGCDLQWPWDLAGSCVLVGWTE